MVTNSPKVLEDLSQEYDHQDKPIIDLGLKPLWTDEDKENNQTTVTAKNNSKNEIFVLPFLP